MGFWGLSTHAQRLGIVLCCLGSFGCSHTPDPVDHPTKLQSANFYDVLIQEARAEADRLRRELAAMKIASAKQQAELLSSQKTNQALRQREDDLASELQQLKASLQASQAENDRLRRRNTELQAQATALPELQELSADLESLQSSIQQMVGSMKVLATDVTALKQDMAARPKGKAKAPGKQSASLALKKTSQTAASTRHRTVTVKPGDTLWRIAQAHGLSVMALKALNDLEDDLIVVGQRLEIPEPFNSGSTRMASPPHSRHLQDGASQKAPPVPTKRADEPHRPGSP